MLGCEVCAPMFQIGVERLVSSKGSGLGKYHISNMIHIADGTFLMMHWGKQGVFLMSTIRKYYRMLVVRTILYHHFQTILYMRCLKTRKLFISLTDLERRNMFKISMQEPLLTFVALKIDFA